MEWSNTKVLKLIDAYRERPVLWNSADPYYKNKNNKDDAWTELAVMLETDSSEIKKKIQSLLASFRRERRKIKRISLGMGTEEVYNTKWFAFKSLLFLKDKNTLIQTHDTEGFSTHSVEYPDVVLEYGPAMGTHHQQGKCKRDELNEDHRDQESTNDGVSSDLEQNASYENEDNIEERPESNEIVNAPLKRKEFITPLRISKKQKPTEDPRIIEAYSVLSALNVKPTAADTRDDCSVYGEHICFKLRSYDNHTRAIVQHHINNIIFNADMGQLAEASCYFTKE